MEDVDKIEAFIARWGQVGGSELANYHLFTTELCSSLALPLPGPARDDTLGNAYVFERRVSFAHGDSSTGNDVIDCYHLGTSLRSAGPRTPSGQRRSALALGVTRLHALNTRGPALAHPWETLRC